MNRTLKNTLIIAAAIAVIGLIMAIIGFATGGMQSVSVSANGIELAKESDRTTSFSQTYTGITSIDAKLDLRDVILQKGSEFKVESKGVGKNFKAENENGTLVISENASYHFIGFNFNIFGFGGNKEHADLVITYPEGTNFQKVSISSDSGNLKVTDIKAGKMKLDSDLGDMDLKNLVLGSLDTNIDSGSLNIENVSTNNFKFYMALGDVDAKNLNAKKINGSSDSGDIDISGEVKGPVDIKNDLGNVDLRLAGKEDQYSYELKTDLGSVDLNGEGSDGSLTKVYENKPLIKVYNDSGDIDVRVN